MYNMTAIEEASNYFGIFRATNDLTSGWLVLFILLMVAVITFIIFRNNDIRVVLIGDSFLVTILAAYFFFDSYIAWYQLMLPVLFLVFSVVFYFITSGES